MAQERLIVGLVDVDVGVLDVERSMLLALDGCADALAREHAGQRGGDVEVECVAELIELRRAVGLNAGRFVARVMAAQRRAAERAEQLPQRLIPEEVHGLVCHFESSVFGVAVALLTLALGRHFRVDEVLLLQLLDDLIDQLFHLVFGERLVFLLGLFVEEFAGFERLADRIAKVLKGLVVELGEVGVRIVEAGVEEEIRQGLHQVFEAEAGGEIAGELCVAGSLHGVAPCSIPLAPY